MSTIILFLCIGCIACSTPSEYFIGKWQILNVVEHNVVTELNENWMHLKSDRTFESYDGELKKNESGTWSYQSYEKQLTIDGEGENDDSEWMLSLKNDTLIFKSKSHDLFLTAIKMHH